MSEPTKIHPWKQLQRLVSSKVKIIASQDYNPTQKAPSKRDKWRAHVKLKRELGII